MAYGDFKDLKRRTASDKVLRDKAFNIAKNPRYDGYQRGLSFLIKSLQVVVVILWTPLVPIVLRPLLHLLLIMILNKTCN